MGQTQKKIGTKLKKKKKGPNSKKVVTKLKKTLRESQKAAMRVGWLSRCWGDKKKLWQLENSDCEEKKHKNSNCDKTQKLKLWQNSKTQNVTKLKNWNWDQTQKF